MENLEPKFGDRPGDLTEFEGIVWQNLGKFKGEAIRLVPLGKSIWLFTTEAVYKITRVPWYRRVWNWFTDWRHA